MLTAAHCFIGRQSPEEWSVGLGSGPVERGLRQLILHGAYTHPEGGYDVALLLLAQPVILGPSLRPLCLPYADHHLPDGGRGWVLGLAHHGAGTGYPQTVPVMLLGLRACNRLHTTLESDGITILPGMVCTSVVGELPRCEVSPRTPKPYPTDPWRPYPATPRQTGQADLTCLSPETQAFCQLAPSLSPASSPLCPSQLPTPRQSPSVT